MDRSTLFANQEGSGQGLLKSARWQLPPALMPFRAPLFVALAYYLGAQAAFAIGTLSDRIIAPFWPPNIVLFCALLLVPRRQWWIYIAAAFPAHLIAETTVAMPVAQSLVAFGSNCMVAVLSAFGVRKFLSGPPWFGTLRQTAIYTAIAAGVSPALSALFGAFVPIVGGGSIANFWTYWGNWCIANSLGIMTLGPVFLIWLSPSPQDGPRFTFRRKIEALCLAFALVAACAIAFHVSEIAVPMGFLPAVLYSPLPLILWAAIRFGERGSSGAVLAVTVVSIWQNLRSSSLFIGVDTGKSVLALQIFLLGIAIPVFFLGTAIDELRRSGEATKRLARALLHAQDEERRRIARELHDSTGQNLSLAHLMTNQVASMAPPACSPLLTELRGILEGAVTEIRTVSYLLHPPLLDLGGLSLALPSYLQGFSKRTGINVDLELPPNLGRISPDVELVLFRVIQEALTNVWRHSGSKTARIRLGCQDLDGRTQITLSVEDTGVGIPSDIHRSALSMSNNRQRVTTGLGLMGMRERLHQIGGQLEIDSIAGKTVVRAIVTLNEEAEEEKR
jgi:signal transduction histidine kinase